jgi:membrane associated rhomboid family serine protease
MPVKNPNFVAYMYQQYRPKTFTKGVLNLIIINAIFYLASWVIHSRYGIFLQSNFALYFPFNDEFRWYQMITHMFMHEAAWVKGGSILHILLNMYGLWLFGTKLENIWGTQRFLFFYFVCGAGAFLLHWILGYAGLIYPSAIIGASGAISGLLVGYGFLFPNSEFILIPIPIPIKAKYLAMLLAGYDLISGILAYDNIAHFAHIGGMLAGVLLILYWRKNNRSTLY